MAEDGRVDPFVELANRGLYQPRGYDRIEYMPQLRGRQAAELYREMEQDAIAGGVLFAIEMVLRRVEWEAQPADPEGKGPAESDIERADFLHTCMSDMSHSWEDFIAEALGMLAQGYEYMEIVYKKRETQDPMADAKQQSAYTDGKVGWRKFVSVPQETIEDWDLDDHGGVNAIVQGGSYGAQRVRIPIQKAVLFRTSSRRPTGVSALRRAVQPWYYRKRLQEIEGIGAERDLAGLPVFTVDVDILSNASRRAEYEKMVRNLRRDEQEGVVLPGTVEDGELKPVAKLELLSSAGSRQFDTNVIIQRYTREIALTLLQDVILLGHEKIGTQALASEKRDLSDTALQAWLNDIAAVLNTHAVPRLFALNGEPLEDLPKLVPGELRPTDVEEFASALKEIANAGWVFTGDEDVEATVRRRLGLPPASPEGGVVAELEDEKERMDQQMERNGGPPEEEEAEVQT